MDQKMYTTILPILIGGLITKIIEETQVTEDEAFEKLYNSKLYEFIENEETKVWTYSVPMLFNIYRNELETGELLLPEY